MVQDIKNWRVEDPFPTSELNGIAVISDRIKALISRKREAPVLSSNCLNVAGVVDMVEGLEYHYSRMAEAVEEFVETRPFQLPNGMRHDVVAYLNRAGQLKAFLKSSLMADAGFVQEDAAPVLQRIMIFRNKYAAHRSLDVPRGESEHEQTIPLLSFAMGASTWKPRPGAIPAPDTKEEMSGEAFRQWWSAHMRASIWQIQMQDRGVLHLFCPEEDHPRICSEAYSAVEYLLSR